MPIQVPQIDWNDQALQELPASHRTPRFTAWMQGMINGSNGWSSKNFYNYCYGDSTDLFWNIATDYNLNDIAIGSLNPVSYSPFHILDPTGVYISLQDGNVNNPPGLPSSSEWWYKISPNYIGAQERAQYNAQKLIMEYALNRWFMTTFRQPTSFTDGTASTPYGKWYLPTSDIFITTKEITYFSPQIEDIPATTEIEDIPNVGVSISDIIVSASDTTYEFIVWIPVSLSVLLGLNYIQIVSKVVNLMAITGTIFEVQTY